MMMSTRSNPSRATRGRTSRRGNTIVLVAGILVLLVILASAYLTRTRAERRTSVAILDAEMRNAKARQIGESLANEVTQALFPAPIDQAITPPGSLADSSDPRLSPERNPQRYGIDQDADGNGLPDHPYNFAPYWVFPFTNWPDGNDQWPQGPGAPNGLVAYPASGVPLGEGNPLGNPGFGDTRWLCDHEPLRWATELFGPPVDTYLDAFSHWRHLTNIARPNNGFRIVTDIADVFDNSGDADFLGTLLLDLNVPVEQWLAIRPTGTGGAPIHVGATGDVNLFLITNFEQRFTSWFFDYINAYTDPTLIPPNFVNLGDLDGDGVSSRSQPRTTAGRIRGGHRPMGNQPLPRRRRRRRLHGLVLVPGSNAGREGHPPDRGGADHRQLGDAQPERRHPLRPG